MSKHPIHQANPLIYSGVERAERRRIAKELARGRYLYAQARQDATRLRTDAARKYPPKPNLQSSCVFVPPNPNSNRANSLTRLADEIELSAAKVPLSLLACSNCHRPTPLCSCELDWGFT